MQRVLSGNVRSLSSEAVIIQRPRKKFAPPSTAKKKFFSVKGLPFFLLRFFAFDKQIISVKIRSPPFANKKAQAADISSLRVARLSLYSLNQSKVQLIVSQNHRKSSSTRVKFFKNQANGMSSSLKVKFIKSSAYQKSSLLHPFLDTFHIIDKDTTKNTIVGEKWKRKNEERNNPAELSVIRTHTS